MSVAEKMTAIADKIRGLLGIEELLTLDDMPDKIGEVDEQAWSDGFEHGYNDGETYGREEGKQAEYDAFWDAYQNGGRKVDYTHAFGGSGWTNDIFKPKYDICPTNAYMMFRYSKITGDLVEILGGLGVKLDFSKCTNMQYCFYGTRITRLGVIDLSSCPTAADAMFISAALKTIDLIRLAENQRKLDGMFNDCSALENVTFEGTIGRDINLQWSPLTPESAWSVVQHLKCFEAYPDPEGDINPDFMKYTVTFSSAVWAALDEYTRENELHGWGTVKDYIENDIGWRTA